MKNMFGSDVDYDVVICGGGLAGLCLARHLELHGPNVSTLVLERTKRPLPDGAFKVGESTIEAGAFYYWATLQLREYLETEHLEKNGLRYFYESPTGRFEDRPEFGVRKFLPAKSYQLDRGKFETHLRELVGRSRATLEEGVNIKEIDLNPQGPHTVSYDAAGVTRQVRTRWVVDATGRRRLIQNKLKLGKPQNRVVNSAWFRVAGKLSVLDFVGKEHREWHDRVQDDRWQSTNHLMGPGYWVWLIPLSGGNTSVGIVAADAIHPFLEYNTFEKAMQWLRRHEPLVAEHVPKYPLMDFLVLRNYSYTSNQVFSSDRWACVGEAAAFADPYYSVGSNMIAFANGFTRQFLELDLSGKLTEDYVAYANRYFLTTNDALTDTIHRAYPFLNNGVIMSLKTLWDYYVGWTTTDPQLYHEIYLDPEQSRAYSALISLAIITQARVIRLFEDWAALGVRSKFTFNFVDYVDGQPTLKSLHTRVLPPKMKDFRAILDYVREAVNRVEEVAHIIFLFAVENVLPQHRQMLEEKKWINVRAISLSPENWERDGLFAPSSKPRDFAALQSEILAHFRLL